MSAIEAIQALQRVNPRALSEVDANALLDAIAECEEKVLDILDELPFLSGAETSIHPALLP